MGEGGATASWLPCYYQADATSASLLTQPLLTLKGRHHRKGSRVVSDTVVGVALLLPDYEESSDLSTRPLLTLLQ